MGRLEKDTLSACLSVLSAWKARGVCLHYDRINSGTVQVNGRWIRMASAGTPDIIAYIKYKSICCLYFIECKSDTGSQTDSQIAFMMKFRDLTNVYYDIVTDPSQVDVRIENITHYSQDILDGIDL